MAKPLVFNDATSPFGRKIIVAALEYNIPFREQFVDCFSPGPLDDMNPLRQIPTLVLANGEALFDSDVILRYLDRASGSVGLYPRPYEWRKLTMLVLADGLMESGFQRVLELRRENEKERSTVFLSRLSERMDRVLGELEQRFSELEFEERPDGMQIAVGCALSYVELRFGTSWREKWHKLATWLDNVVMRESFCRTTALRRESLQSE